MILNFIFLILQIISFSQVRSFLIENDINLDSNFEDKLNPVVLIPGLEGSQLYINLNRKSVKHYYCRKKTKKTIPIWINYEQFVIPTVNCFIDNLKLNYDNITRKTFSDEGVEVSVPGFGSTETIETLTTNRLGPQYYYFRSLVNSLVEIGYDKNKNIKGAPYDFRKAPNEQKEYFDNLIQLIEKTYLENNNKKIIIICHSMGCLYSLNLLNLRVDKNWKKKYIQSIFCVSSPWSGSIRALKTLVTGDNMGVFFFAGKRFKNMEQTFPSIAFLLPNPIGFPKDFPVVQTSSRNYTFNDYGVLFNQMNQTTIFEMYLDTKNLTGNIKFPDVDLHCIYGTGVSTERQLVYKSDKDFPTKPKIIYDTNGDSSVNLESLEYCLKWKDIKKYQFNSLKIDNGDHLAILKQKKFLDYLKAEIIKLSKQN